MMFIQRVDQRINQIGILGTVIKGKQNDFFIRTFFIRDDVVIFIHMVQKRNFGRVVLLIRLGCFARRCRSRYAACLLQSPG
ncbi:hypothetical protein D3C73_1502840 [compost metagenome]